jgi:hypothetical protein
VWRLPRVWQAHCAGLDQRKAKVFAEQTRVLPKELARSVAEVVLPQAAGLTTGQLAARLRRLVLEIDPESVSSPVCKFG